MTTYRSHQVREWLTAKIAAGRNEKTVDIPSLDLQKAVAKSPFYRLPTELRLCILRHAFGGTTIHVGARGSGKVNSEQGDGQTPEFDWNSSLCHEFDDMTSEPLTKPSMHTLQGCNCIDEVKIGVWGWLNSCRWGYLEASDVLFSTNSFFIETDELFSNLDLISWSEHMVRIPALILYGSENHSEPSSEIWEKVERILVAVRDKFPSLRKLHLGLGPYIESRTGIIGSEDTAHNMEKASCLIDDILSGRDEIEIEVSVGEGLLYCNLMVRADNEADTLYSRVDGDERLWRKGSQRQGFWIADRYKTPPADELEESDDDGTRMCGYWMSIS